MVSSVKVGEAEYPVACNAFTPIVFSRAFWVEKEGGDRRPKDIGEAVGAIAEVLRTYGMPPVVPLLEVFYACAKTANPKLACFDEWLGGFPVEAFDLQREDGWATDVMLIVQENFFPHAGEDMGAQAAEASAAGAAAGA